MAQHLGSYRSLLEVSDDLSEPVSVCSAEGIPHQESPTELRTVTANSAAAEAEA